MMIETKHLRIRPPQEEDFDDYWEMNNDPIAKKYTGGMIPLSYDEALAIHKRVCKAFDTNSDKVFSVIEKASKRCIGYCGFKYCETLGGIELSYGYMQQAWGKGYGYEAAQAVLCYGIEVLQLPCVVAAVHPENSASEKILNKIGMQYTGKIKWPDQGEVNAYALINVPKEATEAASVLERLLKDQLIGIYLYGSAILGGLHVNSDVDILALCKDSLSEEIRGELTKELMLISGKVGCRSKRPLEVTLMSEKAIMPWQFPPKYDYMYGEWLREELESGMMPQANEDPDVAILLWQARQYSYTLKGPQITEVTPSIPIRDVQRAIGSCLPHLVHGIKGDERNVLLTLARMWFTLETGEIVSKDKAAEWICTKLPQSLTAVLEIVRKAYLGECHDTWSESEVEVNGLVQFMRQSIEGILDKNR